jgi:hypothetical protein
LNDGAENGTRVVGGVQVPVFDELGVWRASEYSTLRVKLRIPNDDSERQLVQICGASEIGVEDCLLYGSFAMSAAAEIRGLMTAKRENPKTEQGIFGLAAKNEDAVRALRKWMTISEGTHFSDLETVFDYASIEPSRAEF